MEIEKLLITKNPNTYFKVIDKMKQAAVNRTGESSVASSLVTEFEKTINNE